MMSLLWILLILSGEVMASGRVRYARPIKDQIVTIRVALGIATIIQVPDKPQSVIVGDQDSFKVEYLDQAITIKPLIPGVKTNLYVNTDWQRYNLELVTGSESAADYVVYLENPQTPKKEVTERKETLKWKKFKNQLKNEEIIFEVGRVARSGAELLVEFSVKSRRDEKFDPGWVWVTQIGVSRPIQHLYLSGVDLSRGKIVSGSINLKSSDIYGHAPIRIELRRKKLSYLTLPKKEDF
ncbi:MAG TPA: TrbG/VirB9 family P-type conjugative transfer protein [Bacteriovoracaceae bacterium]|nr:TrbG/VirB9 family P-type conjugative transfer protein [Bacteriovoracaceae bacterium]